MLKIILIFVNLAISVLLLSLISWFKVKENQIKPVTFSYETDIEKLKNIPELNAFIEKYVRPALKIQPKTSEEADLKLINFFNTYAKRYDFVIEKYVSSDKIAHYLQINYRLQRSDKKNLNQFMGNSFKSGFIQFKKFEVKGTTLYGTIQLVQPYTKSIYLVNKASDNAPQ